MKRTRKPPKPPKPKGTAPTLGGPTEKGAVQMSETRQILSGSTRGVAAGAQLIGKTDSAANVQVTVVLVRKKPIQHDDLQKHALMRPHERPSTDPAAFAEQYGASTDAIEAVKALAARYGLTVTNVDQPRRIIELSGTAANMEQAFGTTLHDYAVGKQRYRGRQGPILLPTEVTPHIEAVLGLDNRPVAKPRLKARSVQAAHGLIQYPAMMVPSMQRNILYILFDVAPGSKIVMDPFVGSGTALTETLAAGRSFLGFDINPLAVLGPVYTRYHRRDSQGARTLIQG